MIPEWADVIAIDPSGDINIFEDDCHFEQYDYEDADWVPELRWEKIGQLGSCISVGVARQCYFRRAENDVAEE